jgi:hypothetical protein
MGDPPLTGLGYVGAWFARHALPLWFLLVSAALLWVTQPSLIFFDARLYVDATRSWLIGADPWSVSLAGIYFAAPPPTLLVLAPFAVLPAPWGEAVLASSVAVAAVLTVRMLRLPWWWLAFPPLVLCVLSGNIQGWLVPLLLVRAGPLAVFAKVYAGLPLVILGRWHAIVATAGLVLLTAPLLPWAVFLTRFSEINVRLADQSNYGLPIPVLVALAPVVFVALWRVGRENAAWMVVPAVWPSQQWYYATLVMPARSAIAAAIIAVPISGAGLIALLVLALSSSRSVGDAREAPSRLRALARDIRGRSD